MELTLDFDLDDLDESDLNAIIDHLCVSADSTSIIGEFCEENIELIRQNVFTKFKELKVTLAIVKAYREKMKQLNFKLNNYVDRIRQLEDDNNQLQYKINIKNKLLNEMLAFDECDDKLGNLRPSLKIFPNENNLYHGATNIGDNSSLGSHDRLGFEKNILCRLLPETSSSDIEPTSRSTGGLNHALKTRALKEDDGINFCVEKMQELCLHSKNLTKDERNLIEQLLVNFNEHINQNKYINEFLSSNIEDAIQQKDEINYLLTEIERLEEDKNELTTTNEAMTKKMELLTSKLNDVNEKLYSMTKKCEFYEDHYKIDKAGNCDILSQECRSSCGEGYKNKMDEFRNGHRLNTSQNLSSGLSNSFSKGARDSSIDDDQDFRKPQRKKPQATPKFKLVKSMEGSTMLDKWKNLATTSRGLQITKQLFKDDYTADSLINNGEINPPIEPFSSLSLTSGIDMNPHNTPQILKTETNNDKQMEGNIVKRGPKIIPAVTRMGNLLQVNKKSNLSHTTPETPEPKHLGIMSRFGTVGNPLDVLEPALPTFEPPIAVNGVSNIIGSENHSPGNDLNVQLSDNQIKDLLQQLDGTVDVVSKNEKSGFLQTPSKRTNQSSYIKTANDDSTKNNVYNGVKNFLSSYLKSPFK